MWKKNQKISQPGKKAFSLAFDAETKPGKHATTSSSPPLHSFYLTAKHEKQMLTLISGKVILKKNSPIFIITSKFYQSYSLIYLITSFV